VRYSEAAVPLCLYDREEDHLEADAMLPSFLVNNKTFAINPNELRKGKKQMKVTGDLTCEEKLETEFTFFKPRIQICTLHETPNAFDDSQPVRKQF
jgi:hypothetical protein